MIFAKLLINIHILAISKSYPSRDNLDISIHHTQGYF